jgi:hypothetical protein
VRADWWRAERYEPARKAEWDALATRSRAPHFLFFRNYMDYHADRVEDASLLVYEGDRLTALLPANREGKIVVSHGGLTFGGVVGDERMTAHKMLAAFDAIISHLRNDGVARLVYAPIPHIYHAIPAEEDLYALFRYGARLVRRDLSSTISPARRPRPTKGRRSATKRASGSIHVERSFDFGAFMALEEALLLERHGTKPTHSAEELQLLATLFPQNIKLFVAAEAATLLAGVVVYETEVVAHAQYIGASEQGRTRGAVDAIIAYLLDAEYRDKRYLDFGISTERGGRFLNPGLVRNKESYGARGVAYDRYELDLGHADRSVEDEVRPVG